MPKLLEKLATTHNFLNLFAFSIRSPLKYVIIVDVPINNAYLGLELIIK